MRPWATAWLSVVECGFQPRSLSIVLRYPIATLPTNLSLQLSTQSPISLLLPVSRPSRPSRTYLDLPALIDTCPKVSRYLHYSDSHRFPPLSLYFEQSPRKHHLPCLPSADQEAAVPRPHLLLWMISALDPLSKTTGRMVVSLLCFHSVDSELRTSKRSGTSCRSTPAHQAHQRLLVRRERYILSSPRMRTLPPVEATPYLQAFDPRQQQSSFKNRLLLEI